VLALSAVAAVQRNRKYCACLIDATQGSEEDFYFVINSFIKEKYLQTPNIKSSLNLFRREKQQEGLASSRRQDIF
jgi:hypothetical protein